MGRGCLPHLHLTDDGFKEGLTVEPLVEKMDDAATTLRLLQNDVRRGIQRLVREPHYPMQLADLLNVSQPAINKHLKKLERGLVTKEKVPSDKGGPPKRIYSVTQAVSVRIDLGPDLFRIEQRDLPKAVRCA